MSREVRAEDALLVVDVQNDFCPGGALAVQGGDEVVPVVNRLQRRFPNVVLTQDWHPPGHVSFASSHPGRRPFETITLSYGGQVLWPDHCVAGTAGAALHPALDTAPAKLILRKGYDPQVDSYSAFYDNDHRTSTGLAGWLRDRGLRRLFLAGLAADFCVLYSALDARRDGFAVAVVEDAVRGIDLSGSLPRAWAEMERAGVARVREQDLDFSGLQEGPMDKDPVCGMAVGRDDVAGHSEYQDKTYYFCSPACKERFDADPKTYVVQKVLTER